MTDICWIAVGDEILNGSILDSNLRVLAETLASFGLEVSRGLTVRDNFNELQTAFCLANSADIIFVSGGLGPTVDDLTLEAFSSWSGLELEFQAELFRVISQKTSHSAEIETKKQCLIPKTFHYIPNNLGTAPCVYGKLSSKRYEKQTNKHKESIWIFLPGVPKEFAAFLQRDEIRNLLILQGSSILSVQAITCYFQSEGYIHSILSEALKNFKGKTGFYFSEPKVKIVLSGELEEVRHTFLAVETALKSREIRYVPIFSEVEALVHKSLKNKKLTISTCESFTGGLLAYRLMKYSSSSSYFKGGLVLYSIEEKQKFLKEDLNNPVTEEVAVKLAARTRERFESDLAISTTGVAGPGKDSFENEEGLIYIGVATKKSAEATQFNLKMDRSEIISAGVALACFEILDLLEAL